MSIIISISFSISICICISISTLVLVLALLLVLVLVFIGMHYPPPSVNIPSPLAPLGQFYFGAKPVFSYQGGLGAVEMIGLCGVPTHQDLLL